MEEFVLKKIPHRLVWLLCSCTLLLAGCANLFGNQSAKHASLPPAADIQVPPAADNEHAGARSSSPARGAHYPAGPLRALEAVQVAANPPVVPLQPPDDLWQRLRQGFSMPDLQEELVEQQEQWYVARPDYFERMTARGSKYLFHIIEELERRNMPTELALLPYIESAFNPQAVSRAKAMGLWQFMPATGAHYDLKQNAFRDDRRDVLASTRAALDYLQKLHAAFGDWHLALAGYNWGDGNLGKAIKSNRARGKPSAYTDLAMPQETRLYVPKFQAVKNIIARPQAFGVVLPPIANHPYFQEVPIARDIDVARAAQLADVALEDFRALNPSFDKPVIFAAATPQILLPWDNAHIFSRRLAAWQEAQDGPLASWTAWTLPATLTAAEAARHLGWNAAELRRVNHIAPGMKIRAGSSLLVPRRAGQARDVARHVADNATLALVPENRGQTIRVRPGDTLWALARRHQVSVAQLRQWNRIRPGAILRIGQALFIHAPAQPAARTTRLATAAVRKKPAGEATK